MLQLQAASGKPGGPALTTTASAIETGAKSSAAAAAAPALLPWWEPFVYETQPTAGTSRLIVNLLNIPRDDATRGGDASKPPAWDMPRAPIPPC